MLTSILTISTTSIGLKGSVGKAAPLAKEVTAAQLDVFYPGTIN